MTMLSNRCEVANCIRRRRLGSSLCTYHKSALAKGVPVEELSKYIGDDGFVKVKLSREELRTIYEALKVHQMVNTDKFTKQLIDESKFNQIQTAVREEKVRFKRLIRKYDAEYMESQMQRQKAINEAVHQEIYEEKT